MKELNGAPGFASSIEQPVVEGEAPIQCVPPKVLTDLLRGTYPSWTTLGARVDREMNGGAMLPEVVDGLRMVPTSGHSLGYLSFWQPEQRILFCGDTMVRGLGQLRLPFAVVRADATENKRLIRKVAEPDAARVCFVHGSPLVRDTDPTVREFARLLGAV